DLDQLCLFERLHFDVVLQGPRRIEDLRAVAEGETASDRDFLQKVPALEELYLGVQVLFRQIGRDVWSGLDSRHYWVRTFALNEDLDLSFVLARHQLRQQDDACKDC